MGSARDEILGRVRSALRDVDVQERPEEVVVARRYRQTDAATATELVERLIDRLVDYKAQVQRVSQVQLQDAITVACSARNVRRLVVPTDLPESWAPSGVELLPDDGLTYDQIDQSDGVLTGCAIAVAQTGTIILNSGPIQGRRAITLLPDFHLCVVGADQIVAVVPEAITQLQGAARQPITFISGPSATSDIELNRVEGVHGPRTLAVLIVE